MSKELTPLQVLEHLRECLKYGDNELGDVHYSKHIKELDIIETALKDYESLKKAFISLSKDDEKAKKLLSKEIEKNRALEIISKKKVDVQLLKDSKNLNDYNWCVHTKDRALTQKEYDLLKEVFK